MLPQPPMQARPPGPGIWERVGGAGIPVDNPEPPAVTCDCEQPGSRVDDFTSHGGRDPGTDGGQVRGERRRAQCADAEMRWAMSGEVENGDGKPVHPLLGGVRKPCWVTDMLTLVG